MVKAVCEDGGSGQDGGGGEGGMVLLYDRWTDRQMD